MDNVKNDNYYLLRIKENLRFICKHMEKTERKDFDHDELLQDSMVFRLIQISEDAKKLTAEYRDNNPQIPWNDIYGLRNRIVHDYGNVDFTIVFETLKNDIPNVLKLLER